MPEAPPSAAHEPQYSKPIVLLRRLISSIVLWGIVLGAMFSRNKLLSDYVFLAIMMVIAGLGLREFYDLVGKRGLVCFKGWGIFGGLLLMVSTFFYVSGARGTPASPAKANDFETSIIIIFVLGLCMRQFVSRSNTAGMLAISTTLFGLMYVPWLLNFIQKINFFPKVEGRYYVLFFILVTKFSDMGAYCVGSLVGKHKMIPRISPNKTWEGFGGAILFSTVGSLIFGHTADVHLATAVYPKGLPWFHAAGLGILLSVAAVAGDLIESLFKREAGVKDSGRFFPGIGGILDLVDSLLFNAPLMYVYLRHVLTN